MTTLRDIETDLDRLATSPKMARELVEKYPEAVISLLPDLATLALCAMTLSEESLFEKTGESA